MSSGIYLQVLIWLKVHRADTGSLGTSFSCSIFMRSILVFFGSTFEASGCEKVADMSKQKAKRKLASKKVGPEVAQGESGHTGLGATRGERGEVNLLHGVWRFGKSFIRKIERRKGLHARLEGRRTIRQQDFSPYLCLRHIVYITHE